MTDRIIHDFLARQLAEALVLANHSDILQLQPLGGRPPQHYLATFHCQGLVQQRDGRITTASQFAVGIYLPSDYLRRAEPAEVLTWLGPLNVFHPNINGSKRLICIGRLEPGTELVSILYQVFEMIVFRKFNTRDPLDPTACAWTRSQAKNFPTDPRPLRRPSNLARAFAPGKESA